MEGKTGKKKATRNSRLRLTRGIDMIMEDVNLTKKDAGIQVSLCNCDISDTTVIVETTSRDACEQASICCCSEFVNHICDVSSVASQDSGVATTLESAVSRVSHNTTKKSHVPQIANEIVPVSTASERKVETDLEYREAVDVDGVCKELEACDLDDTVEYEYECRKYVAVGCSGDGADQLDVPGRLENESVSLVTSMSEPDVDQSDSIHISMCPVSLPASAVENIVEIAAGDLPGTSTDDPLPVSEDKVVKSSVYSASSTTNPLLTQQSDTSRAEVLHSATSMLSDSCKKTVSWDTSVSDKLIDDVVESEDSAGAVREPDASQSDSVLVSMCDVSLQTSAVADINSISTGDKTDANTNSPVPSFEHTLDDAEPPICCTSSTANPLLPHPSDTSGSVPSSTDMFSDSYKKTVYAASSESSVGNKLYCSGCYKTICGKSSDFSADEKLYCSDCYEKIKIGDKADDANTDGAVPLFEHTLDAEQPVCKANALPPHLSNTTSSVHSSTNMFSDCQQKIVYDTSSDYSVGDTLLDDVFEVGHAVVHAVTKVGNSEASDVPKPAFLDYDDTLDEEMDMATCGIEADLQSVGSGGEIINHDSPSRQDEQSFAVRKVLTSTAVGSPEAVADFFGLAGSSLSGSDQSPKYLSDGGRRKSKRSSRRVSMCGEYDSGSPTEFLTPHRVAAHELTTVVDTDEEDDGTLPSSNLYTTATEECVLDTASESDEDYGDESVGPDVIECVPDTPFEDSEPRSSSDESRSSPPSESREQVSTKHTQYRCSLDVLSSESAKIIHRRSTKAALDGSYSVSSNEGIKRLQNESSTLAVSVTDVQNTSPDEPADDNSFGRGDARNGTTDDKNRYH